MDRYNCTRRERVQMRMIMRVLPQFDFFVTGDDRKLQRYSVIFALWQTRGTKEYVGFAASTAK